MRRAIHCVLAVLFGAALGGEAVAFDVYNQGLERQVKSSSYIFQGRVVDVTTKFSKPNDRSPAGLPYTFVTYQVEQEIKGTAENDTITLRFLGGAINRDEFIAPSGFPMVDLGDRDVLFVRGNNSSICPLVGCDGGRYRIIDGLVFNEKGRSVVLSPEGEVELGEAVNLEETNTHRVSDSIFITRYDSELENEGYGVEQLEELQPEEGVRLDARGFVAHVEEVVRRAHSPEDLASLPPEPDADPGIPFEDPLYESLMATTVSRPEERAGEAVSRSTALATRGETRAAARAAESTAERRASQGAPVPGAFVWVAGSLCIALLASLGTRRWRARAGRATPT